jgi:DNA repair exonuclease SbcCD ATPase subunit
MSKEIQILTSRREEMHQSQDGKIGFYRDRAAAAEKKKQQVLDALVELEEEKKEAEEDVKRLNAELKQLVGGAEKPKTEAQMKQYMNDLKRKTALYQAYRADLQAEKDEVQILTKTEEILRSRDSHIQEFQEQLERERGVQGAQATQDGLEDLSALKGMLDTSKAQTLDEISKIVNTITNTLKARKSKLASQRTTFDSSSLRRSGSRIHQT